jgi:alcohol dehydrogenase class IV
MDSYQIMLPRKIRFGVGCLNTIADEARELGARRALIVTDPGVYKARLTKAVKEPLASAGIEVDIFSEAEPEPTLPWLDATADKMRRQKYDLLVGVGGGSSMDFAKGLSVLLTHGGRGQDYLGVDKVPGPGIPVFALPTTAGTGSETTNIAVFGDPARELKTGMVSPHLFAHLALVDPTLTYGCPPKVTAASGMDALVHAIECYTSQKATTFSDTLALEAMQLIAGNLKMAVRDGSNKESRNGMSEGALFAGMAFVNAGCGAAHALAYPLGSRFHVTHGVANGLLLSYVMEGNLASNLAKYATVARILGVEKEGRSPQEAAEQGVLAARALAADIGLPTRLRDLGVPREALEDMAIATMDVTRILDSNPKPLTLDDVRQIWQNAW